MTIRVLLCEPLMLRRLIVGAAPRSPAARANEMWARGWSATVPVAAEESGSGGGAASAATPASEPRLHSTDIAFKPNQDGWGATKKYSKNHERIFGKKKKKEEEEEAGKAPGVTKLTFKTRQ